MATLEHIQEAVDRLPDEQLRVVCADIVQAVTSQMRRSQLAAPFWTTGEIAGWVGREANDPNLLRGLQVLVGWTNAQLLDIHYLYFDPAGLYPQGQKVSDASVRSAFKSGVFEDPETGDLIPDFEHALEPYFVPSPTLEMRK